jgi:hypothetical protein
LKPTNVNTLIAVGVNSGDLWVFIPEEIDKRAWRWRL